MIRDNLLCGARLIARGMILALFLVAGASAQSRDPFAAVAYVNDRAITGFELQQRIDILRLFRTPGDLDKLALEQLIDDRLRLTAAAGFGVVPTDEAVAEGMAEFAGRANMPVEQFVASLESAGVAAETMRDFIRAGIVWREVVRGLFGQRAQVSDADVDRAMSLSGRRGGGVVVELAEILLPARDAAEQESSERLAQELANRLRRTGNFAEAARQYSVAPSAQRGGRTGRVTPIGELPPALRNQLLAVGPGGITDPIQGGNVVAIFQLINLRETAPSQPTAVTVDYAEYLIAGGRSEAALREAARIAGRVDTCDDLYGINRKQAPERLTRHSAPVGSVPQDVALELAKLDEGEVSTMLTRGDNLVLLMLCSRNPAVDEPIDREAVRRSLFSERLTTYGDGYLAELKAAAIIRYP